MIVTLILALTGVSARAEVAISPPLLRVTPRRGQIVSLDQVAGALYGPPEGPSSFPRFTVAGLLPKDRYVCVRLSDAAGLTEWAFDWRRSRPDAVITFRLSGSNATPQDRRPIGTAIAARAGSAPGCAEGVLLPAAWRPRLDRAGVILVNAEGTTEQSVEGASAAPISCQTIPPGRGNWLAYQVACPAPVVRCGAEAEFSIARKTYGQRAEPLSVRLRGAC